MVMDEHDAPPLAAYPPAPWRMAGGLWAGVFRADVLVPLPADLWPLAGANALVVALVRYLRGPLTYNELVVGPLARRGSYLGIFVTHIWVDSVPSLWGGRCIWGLPKQLATFHWRGATVEIADSAGMIATLTVDGQPAVAPRVPVLLPGFGTLDGQCTLILGHGVACLGRAGLHVDDWSLRFPYRLRRTSIVSLAAKPFYLTVAAPVVLGSTPT